MAEKANHRSGLAGLNDQSQPRWLIAMTLAALALLLVTLSVNLWLMQSQLKVIAEQSKARLFWQLCHGEATPEERAKAFLQLAAAGNSEWRSARLQRLDLRGVQLPGAVLRAADLSESDLSGANLRQADLSYCLLQATSLAKADLENAILTEADCLRADLSDANLRQAVLMAASLEQVTAKNATFVLADLSGCRLLMADLTGANLTGANLSGADLEAAVLVGADLSLARLDDVNLHDADLTNANWWRARGLSIEQQQRLLLEFSPSKDADPARQNDFELWLKARKSLDKEVSPRR